MKNLTIIMEQIQYNRSKGHPALVKEEYIKNYVESLSLVLLSLSQSQTEGLVNVVTGCIWWENSLSLYTFLLPLNI